MLLTPKNSQLQVSKNESVLNWNNCIAVDPIDVTEESVGQDSF
jgi:hypothetical protein